MAYCHNTVCVPYINQPVNDIVSYQPLLSPRQEKNTCAQWSLASFFIIMTNHGILWNIPGSLQKNQINGLIASIQRHLLRKKSTTSQYCYCVYPWPRQHSNPKQTAQIIIRTGALAHTLMHILINLDIKTWQMSRQITIICSFVFFPGN